MIYLQSDGVRRWIVYWSGVIPTVSERINRPHDNITAENGERTTSRRADGQDCRTSHPIAWFAGLGGLGDVLYLSCREA
jgi:hypothetical protein